MVKVTVITAAGRKSDIFEETKTPKDILDYFDVDYSVATNSLDGVKLDVAGMNKSLRDLGVGKECRLSSIVKIDNAAKITVAGAAAVLTSGVKLEDWKRIAKLMPEMMVLEDAETNDVLFRVSVDEGPGSVNEYGVLFGNVTNQYGYATVTVLLDPEAEDKLGIVKTRMGQAILKLNTLESEVPNTLEKITKMEAEIDQNITLM